MIENTLVRAGILLALALPCAAHAADDADLRQLRAELDALRAQYESRIRALEQRLLRAENRDDAAASQPRQHPANATNATNAAGATGAGAAPGATVGTAPAWPRSAASASASTAARRDFNPEISLILSGRYARTSRDPATWSIAGIPLPGDLELGPGDRGIGLGESELGIAANIDPYLRGMMRVALTPENTVAVEEANIQTLGFGNGITVKAGRFYSGIGYLNEQHPHQWDFVDAPLAYQGFLGRQYSDDGVQVRWLAPTDLFVELAAEVGRGRGFPASGSGGNGAGAYTLSARVGGDAGVSHSWRTGLSMLRASARDQQSATTDIHGADVLNAFDGRHSVLIAEAVWKWAPNGNPSRRNFKLQAEYLRRTQTGTLTYAIDGPAIADAFRAAQSGWYVQGVYQFMPRWRVGARADRIARGSFDYGANAGNLAPAERAPRRYSLMLDYSPSEFSRLRLQVARDESRAGQPDNQLFLQYQVSLGAHGAHRF